MTFWKKLLGFSKKENQIIEQPEHEIQTKPTEDIMLAEDKHIDKEEQNKDSPP